jgi:alkaline phosphatase D
MNSPISRGPQVWLLSFLAPLFSLAAGAANWLELGPMIGHVSHTNASLWVKSHLPAGVSVAISRDPELAEVRPIAGPQLTEETDRSGSWTIPDLEPSTRYYYAVSLNGKPAMLPPYPSFVTAPIPGTHEHLRFAFISCSGYSPYDPAPGWADLGMRTNVDLILMMGDNHYGNSPDLAKQRAAYLGQRQSSGFRQTTERIPTYGIWDDHDFGPNDSDGTLPDKESALRAFREHWANPAVGEPENLGVYFKFTRGAVDFFCLDGRYHRSPNKQTNSPSKTMLGTRQLEWLKQGLQQSVAPVKVLVSGSEWQTNGTPDSWTSFPRERDEIFEFIRSRGIEGVILLSGDRHFTGAYQVQQRFIEVTSGPFGGGTASTRNLPEMFLNFGKGRFYCVYDVETSTAVPVLTLEVYQVGMGLLERRTFTWDEVNGRQKIPALGNSLGSSVNKP